MNPEKIPAYPVTDRSMGDASMLQTPIEEAEDPIDIVYPDNVYARGDNRVFVHGKADIFSTQSESTRVR